MLNKLLILASVFIHVGTYGQLADGSTAPDFTLTDYYGTEHNLYDYLDDGKTAIVEIFAAHCSACWNYHQTNRLKNLYNAYGPDGTNELVVLALEYDQWNDHNAFIGDGPPWVTQGNWLEGTPFPIFNVEDPDRGVFADYEVSFYPLVYKICPDRILERIFTSETEDQIYQKVQECEAVVSVDENRDLGDIFFNPVSRNLNIELYQKVKAVRVMSVTGRVVQIIQPVGSSSIPIDQMSAGIYLFEIQTGNGPIMKRFYLN